MAGLRITFSTHNLNGFTRNRNCLYSRCVNEPNTIQCLQEHWLKPPFKRVKGVNELRHVHDEFEGFGTSAMKDSIGNNILKGRPYGGTGFLWNKKFTKCMKPRLDLKHDRVTVLEIVDARFKILCINTYLPYLDVSRIDGQMAMYNDTIGFIEQIMTNHSGYKFILLGDFNCNLYNSSHPFTPLVHDLMKRQKLSCSFDLRSDFDSNSFYTRSSRSATGECHSLLDYIIISEELKDLVSNVTINHLSDNLSDHLPVSADFDLIFSDIVDKHSNYLPASINWENLTNEKKSQYSDEMERRLNSINVPFYEILHINCCCDNSDHIFLIEKYFSDIVSAINEADQCLPRSRPGISKDFWNGELTDLKKASFDAFVMWRDSGKPSSGVIFDLKKKSQYQYKHAVKKAKKLFDQERSDKIHEGLLDGSCKRFWKSWQNIHGKTDAGATRINGMTDNTDIANEFAMNFKRIYDEANSDRAKQLTRDFRPAYSDYVNNHGSDDISGHFLSWDNMIEVMSKLKAGKASGSSVKAEHILHGSPQLVVHLHLLFNSLIQHGYVPSDFLRGVITPIIKDPEGDASSVDNYRGITLSHVFSYLFEHAVLLKISDCLFSDNLQFGYKKKHSTNHAIYTVKRCVDYFVNHGSHVYASFLDCTKGFDRVSHNGLFLKLMKRGVHLCWIRILLYWYSNLSSVCKWHDSMSEVFSVISGVRQGGVLSARFWAVYMDDMICELRKSGVGCHVLDNFIASILYADDVCLLAPSRKAIQRLLDICYKYASAWCIKYNERKSKLMYFGKDHRNFSCSPILLNRVPLDFVNEWKYLGVVLKSDSYFSCSAKKARCSFYRSSNTILNVLSGPSENVQMKLLYNVCVPTITNACEVVNYSHKEMESLHVAVNDAIRRIFQYNRWESIKTLRESFGYLSVTEIFAKRKRKFESKLPQLGNAVLAFLHRLE